MKPLTQLEFKRICREVYLLLPESSIKYTSKAYGWSDDTLLLYPEEIEKHMFFICTNKEGEIPYMRRYIYYIKPNSFKIDTFNNNLTHKVNIGDRKVLKYKRLID